MRRVDTDELLQVLHFDLSPTARMLQTAKDATAAVDVCEEDEGDAVNGVSGAFTCAD